MFHICQFAEVMERNGASYYPEIQTQDEAGAWELGGKGYIAIQSCDDGWDYTLYHSDYSVMDSGQIDAPELTILHGMARFLALYQGEYSRERLVLRLRTVHPKTITRLAQNDTGNVADRHMKQILSIYNGAGRVHNLPCKR